MTTPLTLAELRAIGDKAWTELEQRYPDDATILLVKSIERKLSAMHGVSSLVATDHIAPVSYDLDIVIKNTSIWLFKESVLKPTFVKVMTEELRKNKVPLPEDRRKASGIVSTVYADNPTIFKQFPQSGTNAAAKWHLQPGI